MADCLCGALRDGRPAGGNEVGFGSRLSQRRGGRIAACYLPGRAGAVLRMEIT